LLNQTSAVARSPTLRSNCRRRITPARPVVEEYKRAQRTRLVRLSEEAGLSEPEMLADELRLLLEGARVTAQSVGTEGLAARLLHMGKAMMAAHTLRR
jgi:hypothetical protein